MKKSILLLGIGVAILYVSCSPKKENEENKTYSVINPIQIDTTYNSEYVAEIHARQNVEIRTKIKGYIESIYVDEGQNVKKGQLLFGITNKEYVIAFQKAESALKTTIAELKLAEIEYKNTSILLEKKIVSETELDLMSAKLDAMKAKVEEAKSEKEQAALQLSYTEIKAPFDGTINRIPYKIGSLADEGMLLTTISDYGEVFAYFNMSENDYLEHTGNNENHNSESVLLMMANNKIYPEKGVIETIESEFDKETGNIAFRARFPNTKNMLKHGSNGKIIMTRKIKNAILVPQKSTFEIQDKLYVFKVDKNNIIHQQNIVSLMRIQQYYIVDLGLNAEDKIIFEGVQKVSDGEKITPKIIANSIQSNN